MITVENLFTGAELEPFPKRMQEVVSINESVLLLWCHNDENDVSLDTHSV